MKKFITILKDFFLPTFWRQPEAEGVFKNFHATVGTVLRRFPLAVILLSACMGIFVQSLAGGDPQRAVGNFMALTAFWAVACVFLAESKALSKAEICVTTLCGIAAIWASFCNAEPASIVLFIAVLLTLSAAFMLGPVRFDAQQRTIVDFARVVFMGAGAVLLFLCFLVGVDNTLHYARMPAANIQIREETLALFLLPILWFTLVMLLASLPQAMPEKIEKPGLRRKAGIALSVFAGIFFFIALLDLSAEPAGQEAVKNVQQKKNDRFFYYNHNLHRPVSVAGYDVLVPNLCSGMLPPPPPPAVGKIPLKQPPVDEYISKQDFSVGGAAWRIDCSNKGRVILHDAKGHQAVFDTLKDVTASAKKHGDLSQKDWDKLVYKGQIGTGKFKARLTQFGGDAGVGQYNFMLDLLVKK